MITTLIVIVVVLAFFLGAAIIHIRKIQQELEDLARVNEEQDAMAERIVVYVRDLGLAVNELQDQVIMLKKDSMDDRITNYTGPWGEA